MAYTGTHGGTPKTASDKIKEQEAPPTLADTYADYDDAMGNYQGRDDVEDLAVRRQRDNAATFHDGALMGSAGRAYGATSEDAGQGA